MTSSILVTIWLVFLQGQPRKSTKISWTFVLPFRTCQTLKNEARGTKNEAQGLQNQDPGLRKSSPGPSKTLFLRIFKLRSPSLTSKEEAVKKVKNERPRNFFGPKWANLAPTWRPKRLQNRGPNPKKSMLKNSTFLASIFKGFGPRFGMIFNRFFGPEMLAKSKHLIFVET